MRSLAMSTLGDEQGVRSPREGSRILRSAMGGESFDEFNSSGGGAYN